MITCLSCLAGSSSNMTCSIRKENKNVSGIFFKPVVFFFFFLNFFCDVTSSYALWQRSLSLIYLDAANDVCCKLFCFPWGSYMSSAPLLYIEEILLCRSCITFVPQVLDAAVWKYFLWGGLKQCLWYWWYRCVCVLFQKLPVL